MVEHSYEKHPNDGFAKFISVHLVLQVLNGNPYNRKCDVYSFGICLWEIYCCDMPYPDLSFSEVTSAVVRQVNFHFFHPFIFISAGRCAFEKKPLHCFQLITNSAENINLKTLQNLRPEIPRCCPSSLANVMKRCWDATPDKRPEMDEVVSMLEAIDTSKGGGMIPVDQAQGCLCFRKYRGP